MGGSTYSSSDYSARSSRRASVARDKGIDLKASTFAHDHDIKTGKAAARVHASLSPMNARRESRDSAAHPVSVPIMVFLDTTGSMAQVPVMIQQRLSHLMGCFLDDKASGKKYLGEGYPAIMIGAVDDYDALRGEGSLQAGQFESGIEIDDNLTNLWLTGRGGGTYEESYELALYFAAQRTEHDHWDKRKRKGYCFLIGDEHAYPSVRRGQVEGILGGSIQEDIPLKEIVRQAQARYHVFFVIPNMTQHYSDASLERYWVDLLGQQNVLKLEDPSKICELIAGAVAICEENVGIDAINSDLGTMTALVRLSQSGVATRASEALPVVGKATPIERL